MNTGINCFMVAYSTLPKPWHEPIRLGKQFHGELHRQVCSESRHSQIASEGLLSATSGHSHPFQIKPLDGRLLREPVVNITLELESAPCHPERAWLRIDGKKQAMGPGMTATVDIRTGDRTVLDFFLDPIVKYFNNGLEVR